MTAKRLLLEDILYDIVHFAFFYSFFTLISSALALFMLVPLFCNFAARYYIRNTALMLVVHLIIIALAFLLYSNVWGLAFLVIMLVYSIYRRVKGWQPLERLTTVFMSGIFIIIYFASEYVGLYQHSLTYPTLITIVMISIEIRSRMLKVDTSLEMTAKTSVQPIKQILRFDHKFILVLIVILLIIALAAHFVIEPQLSRISFTGIERDSGLPDPVEAPIAPARGSAGGMDLSAFGEAREAHIIWVVLEVILVFLLRVAFIVVPILLLISGTLVLYRMLSYNKKTPSFNEGEDEKVFIIPEKILHRIRNPLSYFNWNENKVRRAFRKKIQQHIKAGVPIILSDTPTEIAERIKDEDIRDLLEEYQQVRYRGDKYTPY